VTLAPQPFLIFCVILCLSIQHFHTSNKVQYLVDGDVGKVIWFQDMMAQMLKFQSPRIYKAVTDACLHLSYL